MKHKSAILKIILFSTIIITFGIIVSIFIDYRHTPEEPEKTIAPINNEADVSINKVQHTATQDGIKQWRLDAKSTHFIDTEKKVVFEDLTLIYFMADGKEAYLTANQGLMKTSSNDFEASGKVIAKNDDYLLNTEKLLYNSLERTIHSDTPVKITGDILVFTADSMTYNINNNSALLKGNVKVIFDGKLAL
ncbi:MAG: LPS export ABC transporter periplasmic protein LptC [Desulfobacterales bacterium]|jgi:LPS export ABC transporter protein LptC|nr:LPS export ABC transporter periplasmic protein LptC [Desulfobacteraceae bacterium]MBT4363457.1 LPS export ABC transporter periplasmic protein LptC [Desulfobacteraceae bacterium]MBT7086295.1 LPS export ABC transporter periplasmic protein LptC [Desulfobacterales bacterium]MBT7697172.1 LPS export ABC transporter periplasmic protein LptC [Desulfobacterales bacterium]